MINSLNNYSCSGSRTSFLSLSLLLSQPILALCATSGCLWAFMPLSSRVPAPAASPCLYVLRALSYQVDFEHFPLNVSAVIRMILEVRVVQPIKFPCSYEAAHKLFIATISHSTISNTNNIQRAVIVPVPGNAANWARSWLYFFLCSVYAERLKRSWKLLQWVNGEPEELWLKIQAALSTQQCIPQPQIWSEGQYAATQTEEDDKCWWGISSATSVQRHKNLRFILLPSFLT